MDDTSVLDGPLRLRVASAILVATAAALCSRYAPETHVLVTALLLSVLAIAATALSQHPLERRSSLVSIWRILGWLLLLGVIPFLVFRVPATLFFLVFRDSPPSLLDRSSALLFLVSALALVIAVLTLPFRGADRAHHHGFIWVALALAVGSALVHFIHLA